MRISCQGKHQQLSRQEMLLFCRLTRKPPDRHFQNKRLIAQCENQKLNNDEDSDSHLEFLVSLSSPVESLDVAAVNLQSLITVSDSVSVLLH